MSSSTAIPISPDLTSIFKSHSSRYIIVRIENELLVKEYSHPKGGSLESDWSTIAQNAKNKAGYILVQVEPSKYLTITFVPAGTKIKDKMIYAATKATLLNHLGYQHFCDELHANDDYELGYDYYVASKKPVSALSAAEEIRNQVYKQEDEERNFRVSSEVPMRNSGGYHSVSMPFDQKAKEMVRNLASGTYSFVELAVNNTKNGITGITGKSIPVSNLSSSVNTLEPRYYLIKHQSRNAFIYCCPPKSPQKLRMVYSTAKGSVMSEAKTLGFSVSKAGEISEPSELTSSYINELTSTLSNSGNRSYAAYSSNSPTRAGGGTTKAQRQSVIAGAHPIYSLMGSPGSSGRSKKVVLPPPGAY